MQWLQHAAASTRPHAPTGGSHDLRAAAPGTSVGALLVRLLNCQLQVPDAPSSACVSAVASPHLCGSSPPVEEEVEAGKRLRAGELSQQYRAWFQLCCSGVAQLLWTVTTIVLMGILAALVLALFVI